MTAHKCCEGLIFPIYFRTVEELLTPIETDKRLGKAFRVEKSESREVPVPFTLTLGDTENVLACPRGYTGFLCAFTEAILATALPDQPS